MNLGISKKKKKKKSPTKSERGLKKEEAWEDIKVTNTGQERNVINRETKHNKANRDD